ncbi:MAG: DNA primase [Clostridia bacterium]|nr:DNA primase [Clostridia bacterium]
MIDPKIIEEIKFRNDIEGVVSSYVTLKRAGSNFSGSCPFHSEKTPSFVVFPSTQSFYCFGCGAGGDAISFVMRAENIDYISAIKSLAQRAGITLPDNIDGDTQARGVSRQRVLDMNKEAAVFFNKCLMDEALGAQARDYLYKKRGLAPSVIKHFGLGFAPDSFGMLHDHLKKLGYTDEEMYVGFLCGKSKKGTAYDYFRNRIMFPIIDTAGNVVAFGGRVMDGSEPKYLNTSDTPAFKKSRNLFALNFAKTKCEDMLILCEGYMDVISLHAAGFENAVATLGTAITSEQARIFSKYTKKVVISYDSDAAGQRAADKAFNLLQEVGIEVKILKMTGAKDPDEFIKTFGPGKFRELLNSSMTRFDHKAEKILSKYNVLDDQDKIKAGAELCRVIAEFPSEIEREIYCTKAAKVLGISKSLISRDVSSILRANKREGRQKQKNDIYRAASGIGDRINPESSANIKATKAEEAILGLMQLREEHFQKAISTLKADDFITTFSRRVFEKMQALSAMNVKFDIAYMLENFSQEEISRISRMLTDRQMLTSNGADVLDSCIEALRSEKNQKGDDDSVDSLQSLLKKKKEG